MKSILILLLLFSDYSLTQGIDSILLSKQKELSIFVSKILDNPFSSTRMFQKIEGEEIPVELSELIKQKQYLTETYGLVSDSNKTPFYFKTSLYIDSDRWYLSHYYYFDSTGRTILYQCYFAFYDSMHNQVIKNYHLIYFSTNFEIIRQAEWYEDDTGDILENVSDFLFPYKFDLEYLGCDNFQSVIKKYKIKL